MSLLQIAIHLQHSVLFGKDGRFSAHPKWAKRFSKALLSSVFGRFCWAFNAFLLEKKFFCILKNLSARFGCAENLSALSEWTDFSHLLQMNCNL
jgi:hypothetical protein